MFLYLGVGIKTSVNIYNSLWSSLQDMIPLLDKCSKYDDPDRENMLNFESLILVHLLESHARQCVLVSRAGLWNKTRSQTLCHLISRFAEPSQSAFLCLCS